MVLCGSVCVDCMGLCGSVSRSDHSSVVLFFVLVWSGRELGWAVCLVFYVGFCVRPSMVLNQRQVSLVVSD